MVMLMLVMTVMMVVVKIWWHIPIMIKSHFGGNMSEFCQKKQICAGVTKARVIVTIKMLATLNIVRGMMMMLTMLLMMVMMRRKIKPSRKNV